MKAFLYFFHLLSIRPKWAILALAMYGAYQILCLAMVLRCQEVDTISFTPWSFTLQKKKEVLAVPPRTSLEQPNRP